MYYRIFNEVDEHYYPYAYNETDFDQIKDCVKYMLHEMMNNGDIDEDQEADSLTQLNDATENSFPFHPEKTISEVYSIEESEKEFSLNDIPKHMLEYVGQNWR
jgi:SPX domain protein involved in polyphosphate accumulation